MLEVRKICKSYGKKQVLQDLSFAIQAGEVYGLLGPNGAGKTTAISILCGLIEADQGFVKMNGQNASSATRSLIGVAPQENIFYKSLTCEENLRFFGQLYGLSNEVCRKQAQYCLELVGLGDRARSIAETLSGGMQRRLSMAIALVHQPQLVILDEPTTGLDIEARYEVWELIRKLSSQDTAILLTTHMLEEAERLTVTELYVKLRLEQSVASQHLAILRRAGIVSTQRDGKFIYYTVNYKRIDEITSLVDDLVA